MDTDELRICAYYDKPYHKILACYRDAEAWSHILQIRYQPGRSRARMKRSWKDVDKSNAYLVICLVNKNSQPEMVYAHYYADKRVAVTPDTGEGDTNMFSAFFYQDLLVPHTPKILKRLLAVVV